MRERYMDLYDHRPPQSSRGRRSAPQGRPPLPVEQRMRAALLLRRPGHSGADAELLADARRFARTIAAPVRLQVCVSLDGAHAYIYAWLEPGALEAECTHDEPGVRLAPVGQWSGAAAGMEAGFHYVVATDVAPDWEEEFNRWYQTEHMPGLAAVPGSVHCARLRSLNGSPRYHACYDLTSPQVLERDEWFALRHTLWSSRVRPHFLNTRRIMFRTLLDERRAGF